MKLPATFRALEYRNFRLFFGGQLISLIGTWMQNVAQSWLVYKMTHSSVLLGAVGFSSQIPVFLFALVGGIVADRFDRRKVVIATQTASMLLAFVLAALTLTRSVHVWHIFVLSSLLGLVNAFDIPARQSFIVEMVGNADLMNAIALNSSMFNASRMVGPAVAGILVASIGEGWCFFCNALSYIAVIAGLLLMRVAERRRPEAVGSPLANVVEGFRFVFRNPPVHMLLILIGIVSLVGMPYSVLLPIFADRVFHGGATTLGWLMGWTGAGALAGALLLATRTELKGLSTWLAAAATGLGCFLIGFGFCKSLPVSSVLLVAAGFCMMIQMGATNTLVQSMVPDELRGRIMAVYSMMMMGMTPIGSLLAGAAAGSLGAAVTVALGGGICVLAALIFWRLLPSIRPRARQLIVAQRAAHLEPQ
jgi:MFS family permease